MYEKVDCSKSATWVENLNRQLVTNVALLFFFSSFPPTNQFCADNLSLFEEESRYHFLDSDFLFLQLTTHWMKILSRVEIEIARTKVARTDSEKIAGSKCGAVQK